jgi:hypothetical protein
LTTKAVVPRLDLDRHIDQYRRFVIAAGQGEGWSPDDGIGAFAWMTTTRCLGIRNWSLSIGPIEPQLSRGGGRTPSCTGLRLESPTDRYDDISLLVPLVDVPVGLSHLLQWIDTVNDRLQGPGFSKLLEQYQVFR